MVQTAAQRSAGGKKRPRGNVKNLAAFQQEAALATLQSKVSFGTLRTEEEIAAAQRSAEVRRKKGSAGAGAGAGAAKTTKELNEEWHRGGRFQDPAEKKKIELARAKERSKQQKTALFNCNTVEELKAYLAGQDRLLWDIVTEDIVKKNKSASRTKPQTSATNAGVGFSMESKCHMCHKARGASKAVSEQLYLEKVVDDYMIECESPGCAIYYCAICYARKYGLVFEQVINCLDELKTKSADDRKIRARAVQLAKKRKAEEKLKSGKPPKKKGKQEKEAPEPAETENLLHVCPSCAGICFCTKCKKEGDENLRYYASNVKRMIKAAEEEGKESLYHKLLHERDSNANKRSAEEKAQATEELARPVDAVEAVDLDDVELAALAAPAAAADPVDSDREMASGEEDGGEEEESSDSGDEDDDDDSDEDEEESSMSEGF